MKTYARIAAGAVVECVVTPDDIATLFHPGLRWVDVTGQAVAIGDVEEHGRFVRPPPPPAPPPPDLAALSAEVASLSARLAALSKDAG